MILFLTENRGMESKQPTCAWEQRWNKKKHVLLNWWQNEIPLEYPYKYYYYLSWGIQAPIACFNLSWTIPIPSNCDALKSQKEFYCQQTFFFCLQLCFSMYHNWLATCWKVLQLFWCHHWRPYKVLKMWDNSYKKEKVSILQTPHEKYDGPQELIQKHFPAVLATQWYAGHKYVMWNEFCPLNLNVSKLCSAQMKTKWKEE